MVLFSSDFVTHKDDTNTRFGLPVNDTFIIQTDNVERLRVNNQGEVGIGTNDPQTKLQLFELAHSSLRIGGNSLTHMGKEVIM